MTGRSYVFGEVQGVKGNLSLPPGVTSYSIEMGNREYAQVVLVYASGKTERRYIEVCGDQYKPGRLLYRSR